MRGQVQPLQGLPLAVTQAQAQHRLHRVGQREVLAQHRLRQQQRGEGLGDGAYLEQVSARIRLSRIRSRPLACGCQLHALGTDLRSYEAAPFLTGTLTQRAGPNGGQTASGLHRMCAQGQQGHRRGLGEETPLHQGLAVLSHAK